METTWFCKDCRAEYEGAPHCRTHIDPPAANNETRTLTSRWFPSRLGGRSRVVMALDSCDECMGYHTYITTQYGAETDHIWRRCFDTYGDAQDDFMAREQRYIDDKCGD